jgi:hypothetical protein
MSNIVGPPDPTTEPVSADEFADALTRKSSRAS